MAGKKQRVYTMGTDAYHAEFMRVWNDERWESLTDTVSDYLYACMGNKRGAAHYDDARLEENRRRLAGAVLADYDAQVLDRVMFLCGHVAESFLSGGDFFRAFMAEISAYIVNTECRGLGVKWVYNPMWTVRGNPKFTGERLFEVNSDPSIAAAIKEELVARDLHQTLAPDKESAGARARTVH